MLRKKFSLFLFYRLELMVNESGSVWEGIDIGWTPRENTNKITEEAVRRIQDQSKKSQQVHKQIQQDKKTNTTIADFLSFLLDHIKNNDILKSLHELFFKIKQPDTGTTYIRKKINAIVIVWFFFPFYPTEAKKFWITPLFENLLHNEPLNITGYIDYIKRLSWKYHDNIALDPDLLVSFIIDIMVYHNLYKIDPINKDAKKEFFLQIKNELYK